VKIIGFNQGQIGDLAMCSKLAEHVKMLNPNTTMIFGMNKKYESCQEAFLNHPSIDYIHIWSSYNNWPDSKDQGYLDGEKFDRIFHPMPTHKDPGWYKSRHHIDAHFDMHDLNRQDSGIDLQLHLNRYFPVERKNGHVAISLFTTSDARSMRGDKIKEIVCHLRLNGIKTIQLGIPNHPDICADYRPNNISIFDDIKTLLGCDALITADTSFNWFASGYQHPTIGLYGKNTYSGEYDIKNRQPINPNAQYIDEVDINNIRPEKIIASLKNI